jgi:drug/metabolite transporter (DMT)-like permease
MDPLEASEPLNPGKPQWSVKAAWVADVLLLLVAIIWGSTYITAKAVVSTYPIFLFLFLRFSLTVVMLAPFSLKGFRRNTKSTWRVGGILGFFLFSIYSLETLGIFYTSASNAGFLISLCILLVPVVEGVLYKRNPGITVFGVVLLSLVGTGLLTLKDGYHFNLGDLLILAAALMRAIQMVYTKKLTKDQDFDSAALTTIQMAVVAVLTGCVAWVEPRPEGGLPVSWTFWLITLYLALFATLFAFYVQMTMIRRTSPFRVGLLLGTEPLFGALFAMWFGGEALTGYGLLGGGLIVAATYWGRQIELRRQEEPLPSPAQG